jgi:hypothetical protein
MKAAKRDEVMRGEGLTGWKVRRFDATAFDFGGLCEYHSRTIWISRTFKGADLTDVFLHELAHALAPCAATCEDHCRHWGATYRRLVVKYRLT